MDGIHLPASFLKVALRAKGLERSVLVTDAAEPARLPAGPLPSGRAGRGTDGGRRVVLAGQDRLAGSALRMDRGVENLMRLAGLSLADAVRMATVNAARAGRVPAARRPGRGRTRRFRPVRIRFAGQAHPGEGHVRGRTQSLELIMTLFS